MKRYDLLVSASYCVTVDADSEEGAKQAVMELFNILNSDAIEIQIVGQTDAPITNA